MEKPRFTGLSHVCIFVDDVEQAFDYYARILGAVPVQLIPHWKNKGFFQAGGFIDEAERGDVSIGFMSVPGTRLTIELMCYHYPVGRKEPLFSKRTMSAACAMSRSRSKRRRSFRAHQSAARRNAREQL